MLTKTILREQFNQLSAKYRDANPSPLVGPGSSLTPVGYALILVGLLGNSSAGWETLFHGDNTIRIRFPQRRVRLAKPYWNEYTDEDVTHRWEDTGSLVVELVEGRVHGYGWGAPVKTSLGLGASTPPEKVVERIGRFIERLPE